jgi:hypothetical protein
MLLLRILALGVLLTALVVPPAAAQVVPPATWDIEGHGGVSRLRIPSGGTSTLPQPGAPITTSTPVFPSREVPSWFFGDGARLLNDVNREFDVSQRITPLDAALASLGLDASTRGAFGLRVRRTISRTYSVELGLDVLAGSASLTDDLLDGVEASRESFETAMGALLSTGPFLDTVVEATTASTDGSGRDVLLTASVVYDFARPGALVPYVLLGGGLSSPTGDAPTVSIHGAYRADIAGVFPIAETDRVTLRSEQDTVFVGVIGGGVRRTLSPRWGFQVDGRVFIGPSSARLLIDADPSVATGSPAAFIESFTSPAVQFSNDPSLGRRSSLSAPDLNGFEAFTGSGLQSRLLVTVGIYMRLGG